MKTSIDSFNKTLTQTFLFRAFFWGPIAVTIISAGIIYYCNSENIDFSTKIEKINLLFVQFKVSFLLLGSTIPLTALSASIHRSKQTQAQISQQMIQNQFSNHFKHLEEFKKAFSHEEKKFINQIWDSIELMHSAFYPETQLGIYKSSINIKKLRKLINAYKSDYSRNFDRYILARKKEFEVAIAEVLHIKKASALDNITYLLTNKAQLFSASPESEYLSKETTCDKFNDSISITIFFEDSLKKMTSLDNDLYIMKSDFTNRKNINAATGEGGSVYRFHLIEKLFNLDDPDIQEDIINCLRSMIKT
ncbi:hypothetical protein [Neptunomonas phycophila]|uniref:hypothetical protein n=1 Tax=Neptunomonas phycophila TaxID=1572645 RepID=UPI0015BB6A80|nr:hypothetical protein [Neptunomonas phycophila]QLE96334.1 hypothetical protein FLM49_01240 [Neptunomonas phycophila]